MYAAKSGIIFAFAWVAYRYEEQRTVEREGGYFGENKKLIEEEIRENERRYTSLNHVLNIRENFKERDINRSM